MKKTIFAAALAACICCAGVTPHALLRQVQTPQPTEVSSAEGSQLYPAASDPARFLSVNTQYNVAADYLYLSFTNNGPNNVSLTGEGFLETEGKWKQYLHMPRHDTALASAAESGILAEAVGRPIAPGETFLFQMYVGHYKPLSVKGRTLPFREGSYRAAVTVQRENGSAYEWACLPFRVVAGEVQADQNNVSVSVDRAAYSPRTSVIRYTIQNRTAGDLWYDSAARLQKLSGDYWVDVAGSRQAESEPRQLSAGASDAAEIKLGPDAALSPGTYRIAKTMAGLDLSSGQFTVPGEGALRLSIVPKQVSVDWYALAYQDKVKRGYWNRTEAGRDLWLTADDLYDGQSAPEGILRELEAFREDEEPVGFSRDNVVEVTLWDAGDRNITASLTENAAGTYCLVNEKWYKSSDTNVLDRIKTALTAVQES